MEPGPRRLAAAHGLPRLAGVRRGGARRARLLRKLSRTRDRHAGPDPLPGESLPQFLARMNQEFVDVARSVSSRTLVDLLDHLGPQLDRL